MDERIKELVAIGASVSAHCQPCLSFHFSKAWELGIGEDEIREAIEVGYMVERGASSAMKKYVGQMISPAQSEGGASCSGSNSKCCG